MTTLVCAAHADDEVIGVGGTIAKLAKEGEDVVVLVFFYGTGLAGRLFSWPPWISEEELTQKRVEESKKAGKILGVKETIFVGMRGGGGDIEKEFTPEKKQMILNIFKKYKPDKVFLHSIKDGHPEHRFVTRVVFDMIDVMDEKPEVFTYQVNLFDFSEKDSKIIYDVSDTYKKKLKALKCFESQKISITGLEPMILLKGVHLGKKHNMKFAEYFYSR